MGPFGSDGGLVLSQRRYPLPFPRFTSAPNAVSDGKGRLVIATSAYTVSSPSPTTTAWTNPQTGSRRFCLTKAETYIIAIDEDSLDVREQRYFPDSQITPIKLFDGQIYAVS